MSSADDFSKAVEITKQLGTHAKRMVKPKDIPIYGDENIEVPKTNAETGVLLTTVKETRLAVQDAYKQVQDVVVPIKGKATHIIETGKAHSQATYQMIQDENNVLAHAGAIGGSGLVGFIIASFAKRARLLKRLLYSSIGAGVAASVCFPTESQNFANSAYEETSRLGLIAYNFVQGVKPQAGVEKTSTVVEKEVKAKQNTPVGDVGQGNPRDKDMYTTRES